MNTNNATKFARRYLGFLLKERLHSTSFFIMTIFSAIFIALSVVIPLVSKPIQIYQYQMSTAIINYFSGFWFIIYILISCYTNIAKKIQSGEYLLLFSKPISRKNILRVTIWGVILDCIIFLIINLLLTFIIVLIAFGIKHNVQAQYYHMLGHTQTIHDSAFILQPQSKKLGALILPILINYSIMYFIVLLFSPILFFFFIWLSFKKSVIYLFIGGISFIFFIVAVLTIISGLLSVVYKDNISHVIDSGIIIGLFDIRFWVFAIFAEFKHFNYLPTQAGKFFNRGGGLNVPFYIDFFNRPIWQVVLFNVYFLSLIIGPVFGLYFYCKNLNRHYLVK